MFLVPVRVWVTIKIYCYCYVLIQFLCKDIEVQIGRISSEFLASESLEMHKVLLD